MSLMTMSMSLAKEAGAPVRPIGVVLHLNWPIPGMVNAVKFWSSSFSAICQKPEVRSRHENTLDPALPTSAMHSSTPRILYLSGSVLSFKRR